MKQSKPKFVSAQKAISDLVSTGDCVGMGGFSTSRNAVSLVHEIIRQQKKSLTIVGTNLSFGMDLMVAAGLVSRVESGTGNLEKFGVAYSFRRAIEKGELEMEDHSHLAIISRLLAGEMGIPFIPIRSWFGSDLLKYKQPSTIKKHVIIKNPFSSDGEDIVLVPALNPDVALLHVQKVDDQGNVSIDGVRFHDIELARAAKKLIVSTETIVDPEKTRQFPQGTSIPFFYVDAVVHQPWGAHPTSVYKQYGTDEEHLEMYQKKSKSGEVEGYLAKFILGTKDWNDYLDKVGRSQLEGLKAHPEKGY